MLLRVSRIIESVNSKKAFLFFFLFSSLLFSEREKERENTHDHLTELVVRILALEFDRAKLKKCERRNILVTPNRFPSA